MTTYRILLAHEDSQVSAEVMAGHALYRCLDRLPARKRAFFSFLRGRWESLFDARLDVLLYDLTFSYFESDPPFSDKRRFGYSRTSPPTPFRW